VWDSQLPGFGVRIRSSGHKTYVLFYRARNRKRIRKLTLGSAKAINATKARRQAREILGQIAAGKDPADERLAYRDASLQIAFAAFKSAHLPEVSREHARHRERIFERHFLPKLGDKVLSKISRAEIKEIIDRIAKKHKVAACNAHRGFSAFLSWCVEHGLIEHHVLRGSKLPAQYRPRERVSTVVNGRFRRGVTDARLMRPTCSPEKQMALRQSTIEEIIETERALVLEAVDRYGEFYEHALDATVFLSHLVKSADISRQIFVRFLSQIKKHDTLALFWTVRQHRVQGKMNLRQVLEAATCAAYATANPHRDDFVGVSPYGLLDPSQALARKRHMRLHANFPAGSADIKRVKDVINKSFSHANFISASHNYSFLEDQDRAAAPFFDVEDDHVVKIDLWLLGKVAIVIAKLFHDVIKTQGGVVLADDFASVCARLADQNARLRDQLTATERYKRVMNRDDG
jgi:Arm DNA-binding domain